uniref:uncharacterized protein n=1 Tax=Pristiophorus japonicus TaxID=55135 RepID=UPI00398E8BD3
MAAAIPRGAALEKRHVALSGQSDGKAPLKETGNQRNLKGQFQLFEYKDFKAKDAIKGCKYERQSQKLTVSQTPSVIKALKGQTVKIYCSYSDENGEQLRITWGKHNSAHNLCDYTYNKNKTKYRSWYCLEQANITLDFSTNSSSLIFHDLHLNDSDIYFCQLSIEIPPPIQTAEGTGTHLTVEARPTVQLRAETLPYPNEGVQLICTSLEFYPDSIQVSWFKDGQLITNGTENGTLYCNSDGTFSITSFLNLSVFDWNEGGNYSCQVNHSTLSAPITERAPGSNRGVAISESMITAKTKDLKMRMNLTEEYIFSQGWLTRFKHRHGICQLDATGEKKSADNEAAQNYSRTFAEMVQEKKLTADQIYNADETGVLWKCLPTATLAAAGEKEADVDDEFEPPSMCQVIKHPTELQTEFIRATSAKKQGFEVYNSLIGK